jgi:hypothetical protein
LKKRSKYRPKGIRLDNLSWIKAGMQRVGTLPQAGVALKLKNHEALDSVRTGHATRDHIDVLIAAFNVAEALWRLNPDLGEPHAADITKAQDALFTMGQRYGRTGSFAFTGPELMAVRFGMEIHDAQLDQCTVREMEHAIDLVNKEVMAKKARPILTDEHA